MIRKYDTKKLKFPEDEEFRLDSWKRGLNTLVSATKIRDDELAVAQNIELSEIGQVTKRRGRAYYGNEYDSAVEGLGAYYKSDGFKRLLRKSDDSVSVYNSATEDWDDVSGATYTTGYPVNFVQAYDRLYCASEVDALAYYDGSTLTVFNSASMPTTVAVSSVGGGGTETYSYRVASVTEIGDTMATTSVTGSGLPTELTTANYAYVSWNSATEDSVIGYNIYGRKYGKEMWIAFKGDSSAQSYNDTGTTPSTIFGTPRSDTTQGPPGEIIAIYKDSIFIAGNPDAPSRLYYSAGGDKLDSFAIDDGGGFIEIQRDDGDEITALEIFQDKLVVFKKRSIHQFTFATTGLPQVSAVNLAVGCIGPRALASVENDVFFLSEDGVFVLGNEPNYFNVIRTNELSSRIRPKIQAINGDYIADSAAIYYDKLFLISVPDGSSEVNDKTYVYDRERLAWYEWDFGVNCWAVYYEGGTDRKLLYGEESSGYTSQMTGEDDFGSAFTSTIKTKQVDLDKWELYKRWKHLVFHFRNISGTMNVKIWVDGTTVTQTFSLSRPSGYIGWGYDGWGATLWGATAGTSASASDIDVVKRKRKLSGNYRSVAFEIEHDTAGSFSLLSIAGRARVKSENFYPSTEIIA